MHNTKCAMRNFLLPSHCHPSHQKKGGTPWLTKLFLQPSRISNGSGVSAHACGSPGAIGNAEGETASVIPSFASRVRNLNASGASYGNTISPAKSCVPYSEASSRCTRWSAAESERSCASRTTTSRAIRTIRTTGGKLRHACSRALRKSRKRKIPNPNPPIDGLLC